MHGITRITALQVLDSRGNPTISATVSTDHNAGSAMVPSGASTGSHEAIELRDGKKAFQGKSVNNAIKNIAKIEKAIKGFDINQQKKLDHAMIMLDGTKNKSKLGANAILGVSLANARCAANTKNEPLYKHLQQFSKNKAVLPIPFANVINGGVHAQNKLSIQEFMIVPQAKTFSEATRMVVETYHELKNLIIEEYGKASANVGDEGGFAPNVNSVEEALDLLVLAIKKAGYTKKMFIALDCAANEYYKNGVYIINDEQYSPMQLIRYYERLLKAYPIISIEDPFAEDDFDSFSHFTERNKVQIVGDDLLVTNLSRIKKAVQRWWCNSLLLKVNQIGTLSEAIDAAVFAQHHKMSVMVSHRSGETEDSFIADLAVALGCGQIKLGAPCRGERTAKYNRLLKIEQETGLRLAQFSAVRGH